MNTIHGEIGHSIGHSIDSIHNAAPAGVDLDEIALVEWFDAERTRCWFWLRCNNQRFWFVPSTEKKHPAGPYGSESWSALDFVRSRFG